MQGSEINFSYKLIRKSKKNLSIRISGKEVIVSAPLSMNRQKIEEILLKKKDWIEKKLSQNSSAEQKFLPLLNCKEILIGKIVYPVVFVKNSKYLKFDGRALLIPDVIMNNEESLKASVKKWYKAYAKIRLCEMLERVGDRTKLKYNKFSLTDSKNKWGSCDRNGNIKLNWRLAMLEEKTAEYVVIHELCHTYYLDHSKNFWNLVSVFCPDYKLFRKTLKMDAALCMYLKK